MLNFQDNHITSCRSRYERKTNMAGSDISSDPGRNQLFLRRHWITRGGNVVGSVEERRGVDIIQK